VPHPREQTGWRRASIDHLPSDERHGRAVHDKYPAIPRRRGRFTVLHAHTRRGPRQQGRGGRRQSRYALPPRVPGASLAAWIRCWVTRGHVVRHLHIDERYVADVERPIAPGGS
jgi:hypothetical protein